MREFGPKDFEYVCGGLKLANKTTKILFHGKYLYNKKTIINFSRGCAHCENSYHIKYSNNAISYKICIFNIKTI